MTRVFADALLIDLDGTLVDSTASVLRNWARIAAMLGREGEDILAGRHGIPGRQVLRTIEPGLSEERIRELDRALLGALLLGEAPSAIQLVGVVIVVAGVAVATARPRERATAGV